MSSQRSVVIAVCLSLFAASTPALADERDGAYVFAGVGLASTAWKAKPGVAPAGQKRTITTRTTSYQVGAGYRFNDYLGVEANYGDMVGQARRAGIGGVEGKSLAVGAVGYLPIGDRFELFAKAGVGRSRYDFYPANGGTESRSVRATSTSPLFALGANYHLNRALAVRLEWSTLGASDKQFRKAVGADSLATAQWTAGLNYRF